MPIDFRVRQVAHDVAQGTWTYRVVHPRGFRAWAVTVFRATPALPSTDRELYGWMVARDGLIIQDGAAGDIRFWDDPRQARDAALAFIEQYEHREPHSDR